MKTELRFTLDGQKLRRVDDNTVASNAVNVPTAVFENLREDKWEGFGSYTAEFKNGNTVISVFLADVNECAVPHEVLSPGYMCVTVYAESAVDGKISRSITSTEAEVRIERGPSKHGDNSRAPTADEVAQIKAAAEAAASVRADADAGKFNGEVGATPNITIGSVTTLEAGESAAVTVSGSPEKPIFNFALPRGMDGESLYVIATIDELNSRAKASASSLATDTTINILWIGDDFIIAGVTLTALSCYKITYKKYPVNISYSLVVKTKSIQSGNVSDEQIQTAVNNYLTENPVNVTTDTKLSKESNNPIANSVVAEEIGKINGAIGGLDTWLESI